MEGYSILCNGDSGALFGGDDANCPMRTFGYATAAAAENAWNTRANATSGTQADGEGR
jgi:hypothetical protein